MFKIFSCFPHWGGVRKILSREWALMKSENPQVRNCSARNSGAGNGRANCLGFSVYMSKSIVIEMGGVSRCFSEVSGPGVDATLQISG